MSSPTPAQDLEDSRLIELATSMASQPEFVAQVNAMSPEDLAFVVALAVVGMRTCINRATGVSSKTASSSSR
ncbi:hypothetical protein K488DRAFT_92390 [Vararia minispora EC-137]|uniref:Uncharacterized protein n=1 Tax=Vararia minispora EC-137 TaxID=1314806 RepID=A0ACB8Q4C6_9AGAM|nr:hypothetical protein K488DRAFT_92390 [Vararia minispora EC-137]